MGDAIVTGSRRNGEKRVVGFLYTQYPIIRNGLIRNSAEFLGKFKKRALGMSKLRNISKNLRNK